MGKSAETESRFMAVRGCGKTGVDGDLSFGGDEMFWN